MFPPRKVWEGEEVIIEMSIRSGHSKERGIDCYVFIYTLLLS